jgi:tetratricopeptide (TPR) repeat protein
MREYSRAFLKWREEDTLNDHPQPAALEAFLRADLPGAEMQRVFLHLMSGCPVCRAAMSPLSTGFFRPSLMEPRAESSEYDFPIARAIRATLQQAAEGPAREPAPAEPAAARFLDRPLPLASRPAAGALGRDRCEALLEAARGLRHRDPEGMVMVATYAAEVADRLGARDGSQSEIADLQARAWAELANARRITGDLPGAEADLERALTRAEQGTNDPLLLARIMDLTASLYRATGRFAEAHRLLDGVYTLYRERGDLHLAGRARIAKGISVGTGGDPGTAIGLLGEGLATVDSQRDPLLILAAVHNLIVFLVDAGLDAEGERLILATRPLYTRWADSMHLLKLDWIAGRIAVGRGDTARAAQLFAAVRQAFAERQMPFTAAEVAMDQAALWLEQGQTAAVRELVEDLLVTFRVLGLRREAIAALLLLREAMQAERLTFALLKQATAQFQRLEREPDREAGTE